MVNGPRPAPVVVKPTGMLAASKFSATPAHVQSPTILQRQHTSVYSTCSTSTPNLVFGKAATPIVGAWSAEPWTPSNLVPPALEDLLEDPHRDDEQNDFDGTERDASSAADTAAYQDAMRSPLHPKQHAAPENSITSMPQQAQQQQHFAHVYRHDPYTMLGHVEVFRCQCDDCLDDHAVVSGRDDLISGGAATSTTTHYYHRSPTMSRAPTMPFTHSDELYGMQDPAFDDIEHSSVAPTAPGAYEAELYWSAPAVVAPPTTNFVPPPPPPHITRRVMADSAEPAFDVDAAFYHIAVRWYNKVSSVQDKFVPSDDLCPAPGSPNQSFDEWIAEVGKWWLRHFEHAQTKTTPSSGLLRSSYGSVAARATGFATHANGSSVPASRTHAALRQEPRRQLGSSGLTAEMLESLNSNSTAQTLAARRREELPW